MKYSLVLALFLLTGCAWFSKEKQAKPPAAPQNIILGKVVNQEYLKNGGNLLIVPFQAGANVFADEQLDDVTLRIIQGIADRLKDNKPYFNILLADNANEADLIIDGYVTEMVKPSSMGRWVLQKKKKHITIKAKMTHRDTGETILIFSGSKESTKKDADYNQLGYGIGEDIGNIVLTRAKEVSP